MSYTSLGYYALIIFLVALYYIFPKKIRWVVLLLGSLYFYSQLFTDFKEIVLFALSIVVSYSVALLLDRLKDDGQRRLKRAVLWAGIILSSLPLIIEKIGDLFFVSVMHRGEVSWIIPVGLSFYTLQLIAYMVDVYRGDAAPQRNFLKFTLFASFFPQIIQGPIPRYDKLEKELFDGNEYDFSNIISGLQLLLWGFFLKLMIADRAAVVVDTVFDNYKAYKGGYVLVAAILYSLQLYTDFLSCTTLSQGVSELFGIHLGDNFMRPYFSTSVKDFWRRWHISLSSWLKDYVYIPLGGNRKGNLRKEINILITFAVSGIWHGGSLKFLFWGLLHGIYQVIGDIKNSFFEKIKFKAPASSPWVRKHISRLITFFLVMMAWIIFRAESLKASLWMIRSMFVDFNPWIFFDDSLLRLGLSWKEWLVLIPALVVLLIVSTYQEKGVKIRAFISGQNLVIRWIVYLLVIWCIWIFGSYGYGFDANSFIYGGF